MMYHTTVGNASKIMLGLGKYAILYILSSVSSGVQVIFDVS